ncbi:MAG: transcription-repair coupling factor, partial [Spirochaetia bacterium]
VGHGIGRYQGIRRIKAAGFERDYMHLEYAGGEYVYIPIEQVNLVQRYIGHGGTPPRLDTIGGKSWENRKSKVRKSVEDLAEHLIKLYSQRKRAHGYAFPPDIDWQYDFEAGFPFEETPDQLRCIAEVKQDMERPAPMDRLVCGDVGYGKTEIAMRAAFKAVSAGKQVALLAPTTILAEQHYENINERLQKFPVKTAMLSRFVPKPEQKKALAALAKGDVDLIVGTHRILQKDVVYADLGLIIVDEEQRFGVKDKERLKELKHSVDSLTLTATPIPRTLHMSLLKIRDMSILQTPPNNRLPIETVIRQFSEDDIAMAIQREIERGGQVYFLHNRIETLGNVKLFIERLLPEVMVESAHGQMSPSMLEDIMHRFIHGGFHVLVSTTIIENGIDIPNVNTIIIDRADMYGIAQLYQLRGRVGRSDKPAYAYLFYPEERALSEIAMKRLQIISDYTELGSGFKIALKDLEVRGAGNLLGRQQSGDILSVGFDMYLRLLDEAIRELDAEMVGAPEFDVYLELEYSGFIPDAYIDEPMEKMGLYKRIAGIGSDDELTSVVADLEDRFGPMPDEVQSLLSLAEIRILCRRLKISSLRERKGVVEVEFSKLVEVSVDRVLRMIESSGGKVRLNPHRPDVLLLDTGGVGLKEKSEFIRGRLSSLL